jgi:outer membrane protein TolC
VASVNVTIPLFAGGATYQRAQEATKQLLISKQRKISLLRSIEKETRDAFLSANASVRRIKAVTRAQKTAIKAREAMEKGFYLWRSYNAGFFIPGGCSHEAHSYSTQRMRAAFLVQKD